MADEKLPTILLNTCRIFGPRQWPDFIVPKTIYRLLNSGERPELLDSQYAYEWMYIGDFLSAVATVIKAESFKSKYNVASGASATEVDIYNRLAEIVGKEQITERLDLEMTVSNCMDFSDLLDIGWQPKFALNGALEHTANWYNSNKWAYRELAW